MTVVVLAAASTPGFAVEYFLRAERIIKTVPDSNGVAIPMWGFAADSSFDANDGQVTVPGPMLTVPVGDPSLTIHLDNNLTVPISIVINGQNAVMTPVRNPDGRIRSFTHETEPNNPAPVNYTWANVRPGTYIYQSGTHPAVQVQMGLYGGVVKDYAAGNDSIAGYVYQNIPYEVGVPLFFSEIDPALHNAVDTGNYGPGLAMTSTIDYDPKYFLINGQAFVPGQAALSAGTSGGGTLLRLFNMGLDTRCPLLQGSHMKLVAEDGQPYRYPKEQYVVSLPAGKTIDAMVAFPSAGTYPIYDRRLGLTNAQTTQGGMLAHLDVGPGNFWPVINSVSATPASILDTQASQLLVSASDTDGPAPLSYSWNVPLGGGSLSDPTIANPVYTPPFIAGTQTYTLTVTVSDSLHIDVANVDVTVTGYVPPVEVIVDNMDAETSSVGVWSPSGASGFWATDSVWANDAGDSYTFNANLAPGNAYAVYGWWTAWSSRHTAVPYEIRSGATLLNTVNMNQQANGGQWNLLGAYVFNDAAASVTVLATPGASTCADAVRFVPLGTLQSLTINGAPTVYEGATANCAATATFSGGLSLPVQPQVWSVDVAEASISPTGVVTAGMVAADTPAVITAEYTLNGTTVSDTHNMTILNGGGVPVEVIVDNLDAETSSVGVWSPSGASGFWATNSVWANDAGDSFTFTPNLVPGTTYEVYGWWTVWPSRNTAAPYEIRDGATLLDTVNVNQQFNGGQWNLLGTYTFTGTASVAVLASPGSSTNADAVRFVPVTTPVEVIVDNLDATTSSVGVWSPSGASGFWATNSVWANDPGDSFTFTANLMPGTNYEVYGWWTVWPSRNTAAPYEIRTGATLLATVNVNQQLNGDQWNLLGTHTFTEIAGSVTVLASPGSSTCADAVRFVPVP